MVEVSLPGGGILPLALLLRSHQRTCVTSSVGYRLEVGPRIQILAVILHS